MRANLILLSLALMSCTRPSPGVAIQRLSGGVVVEDYGFNGVPSGGAEVTAETAFIRSLSSGDLLVAIGEMQHPGVVETISDTAGLSWTQIGTWTQDESNVGEGSETLTMFAARAPSVLSGDTITVQFGQSAGAAVGVLALANAGWPVGFTHSSDANSPAPAFTMNPQAGSILFGGGVDVSGDCCFAWAAMANTTLKGIDGLYSNDYGVFWTTVAVDGGPVTFGTTKAVTGFVDWGGVAVEIPASGGQNDAGTPDAGATDAGTPDAGVDGGTCSWVCQ